MTRHCLLCALALCFGLPVRAADKPEAADVPARPAVAILHVAQDKNDRSDYRTFRDTQAVLLKSRLVLNGALRKPGIAELDVVKGQKDPAGWLADNLRVAFPLDGEALTVTLRVGKPFEAARLVNAVVETYLEEFALRTVSLKRRRLEELIKLHQEYAERITFERRKLADLTETLGSGDDKGLLIRQEYLLKEINVVQTELFGLQSDLRKAQVDLATYEAKEKEPLEVPPSALEDQVEKDPRVKQLKDRVASIQLSLDHIRERVVDPSSEATLSDGQKQLERARVALESRRKEVLPAAAKELQDKLRAENKARAAALREKVDRLKKLEKLVALEVEERKNRLLDYGRKIIDLESRRDLIRLREETLKPLSTEMESLGVEVRVPQRINLIDKAEVPGKE